MELEQSSPSSRDYWTDIDALDHEDPMACTEYVHDIVYHLLEAEVRFAHVQRYAVRPSYAVPCALRNMSSSV